MTREEQDKLWAEHSKEVQQDIIERYNSYDTSVPVLKALKESLEYTYGKHNLQSTLTYENVAKELFADGKVYCAQNGEMIRCTSCKQAEKLTAINKLLNVAKFLNKNKDGTDWVPDWGDTHELKYYPLIYDDGLQSGITEDMNHSIVYFRTKELLDKAVQILGKDVVRTALTTEY